MRQRRRVLRRWWLGPLLTCLGACSTPDPAPAPASATASAAVVETSAPVVTAPSASAPAVAVPSIPACEAVVTWFAGCYPERIADRELLRSAYARLANDPREPNLLYDCMHTTGDGECPLPGEPPAGLPAPDAGSAECNELITILRCHLGRTGSRGWKIGAGTLRVMEEGYKNQGAKAVSMCSNMMRDERHQFVANGCVSAGEFAPRAD